MEQTTKGLTLTRVNSELQVGVKSNGIKYSVRDDRSRYFYPNEWIRFYNALRNGKEHAFDILINTGGRIEETLNIQPEDFDWERNNLTLRVTKKKASKGERIGRKRTFVISSQFARRMRKYISVYNIKPGQRLVPVSKQAISQMLKRTLKKIGIKDWYNFSLHNIRKTHGNWLKASGIKAEEICLRLGHDFNTYLKHYGSADIYDRRDKQQMIKILGDIYGLK